MLPTRIYFLRQKTEPKYTCWWLSFTWPRSCCISDPVLCLLQRQLGRACSATGTCQWTNEERCHQSKRLSWLDRPAVHKCWNHFCKIRFEWSRFISKAGCLGAMAVPSLLFPCRLALHSSLVVGELRLRMWSPLPYLSYPYLFLITSFENKSCFLLWGLFCCCCWGFLSFTH